MECNICFDDIDDINNMKWLSCFHSLCIKCFDKLCQLYCPYCRNPLGHEIKTPVYLTGISFQQTSQSLPLPVPISNRRSEDIWNSYDNFFLSNNNHFLTEGTVPQNSIAHPNRSRRQRTHSTNQSETYDTDTTISNDIHDIHDISYTTQTIFQFDEDMSDNEDSLHRSREPIQTNDKKKQKYRQTRIDRWNFSNKQHSRYLR